MKLSLLENYKEKVRAAESIEERLFWVVAPLVSVLSIFAIVVTIYQQLPLFALLSAIACVVIPPVIIVIFAKKKKYALGYNVFCTFMCCVTLPIAFFANGGLHSGMPLYILVLLALSFLTFDTKLRLICGSISIFVSVISFLVAEHFPQFVIPLESDMIAEDIILCFIVCAVCLLISESVIVYEVKDYASTRKVLNQVLDARIYKEILEKERHNELTGENVKVVVLFADICNFTSFSERHEPEVTVQYLNEFMGAAERAITLNNGVIDKFIGDCVMAFWVDQDGSGSVVKNACQAFIDMQNELYLRSDEIFARYDNELAFAAGIGYGEAIFGSIGTETRKDYTITGDAVNLASRLQDIAPKGYCYVSKSVYDIMQNAADMVQIPRNVVIKGKSKPVSIYMLRNMRTGDIKEPIAALDTTGYALHVCGCRGSNSVSGYQFNEFGGETSCYVLKKDKYAIVVDCGTGLYNAKKLLEGCTKVDIILTHVHYDHILGLLDWFVFPAGADMRFYGNFNDWRGDETVRDFMKPPFWPITLSDGALISVEREVPYILHEGVTACFYRASHPNNANVIALDIKGHRVCVMADCENPNDIPDKEIRNADLVLYDGMFEDKDYERHIGWGHSTWESAVRLATEKNVGRMVVTHHNPHNNDAVLRGLEQQAKSMNSVTTFAREGDIYVI